MATIEVLVTPTPEGTGDAADPFRYGWRYVQREENGMLLIEQVPLTLEDVLHPREGDQVTHSDAHQRRCRYLVDVFEAQLAVDPTAVILHDVRVAWDVPELRPHGPDVAVILGVREHKNWSTFDVAAEGVRPALIVEVTSPETAAIDRSTKVDEYELAGVPLYVIIDAVSLRRQSAVRLLGYTLTPTGYQPLTPDGRGWLWLASTRTWLGVAADEIVLYDEHEQPLGDYRALATALAAEAQARLAAEGRADEAEERASQAERRAGEAKGQAAAERRARVEVEMRLQALEAELRRLRGEAG